MRNLFLSFYGIEFSILLGHYPCKGNNLSIIGGPVLKRLPIFQGQMEDAEF